MFDQMLKVIFLKMKETRKKVIWEQSVRAKLEEKYRHKRWNERGGGQREKWVPTEGGSARVVHLQPETSVVERRKKNSGR